MAQGKAFGCVADGRVFGEADIDAFYFAVSRGVYQETLSSFELTT
jgi:hypothetical protein